MPDTTFREAPGPAAQPTTDDTTPNETQVEQDLVDIEPVETGQADSLVLDLLGIADPARVVPDEDKSNLREVSQYILDKLSDKGVSPTMGSFKRTLEGLKEDMGLDPEADPAVVLDRIGG